MTCSQCGGQTTAVYRVCDPCFDARQIAERAAQGLGPGIDDPAVLSDIDTHLYGPARDRRPAA